MADEWITTTEAADLADYHPEHIRRLIRQEKVKARKFGIVWQVDKKSLLAHVEQMENRGEKRGPKKSS